MAAARNDPCPCGSGLKYKKCCLKTGGARRAQRLKITQTMIVTFAVAAVLCAIFWKPAIGGGIAIVGLISVVAYWLATNPPPTGGGGDPSAIRFGG